MANKSFPSVSETVAHPAYPGTLWKLEPHSSGRLAVAENRGGPVHISWEMHGSGPIRVAFISGLGTTKAMWQRQIKHLGHDRGDRFSVLVFDNRGVGGSDKRLGRYTTSGMAADVLELLDHVGWAAPRSVHIVGLSMGGMILQELACVAPQRPASVAIVSSAARAESTGAWYETLPGRLSLFLPKSLERSVADTARQLFPASWLAASDGEVLPSPRTTPRCGPAPGTDDGEYIRFDSNFQRFQAQELTKRRDPAMFSIGGFLCQLAAAAGHRASEARLRAMADAVGRERIAVVHGTEDSMIDVELGRRLIRWIGPAEGRVVEGMGHAAVHERAEWFNGFVEEWVERCEELGRGD